MPFQEQGEGGCRSSTHARTRGWCSPLSRSLFRITPSQAAEKIDVFNCQKAPTKLPLLAPAGGAVASEIIPSPLLAGEGEEVFAKYGEPNDANVVFSSKQISVIGLKGKNKVGEG